MKNLVKHLKEAVDSIKPGLENFAKSHNLKSPIEVLNGQHKLNPLEELKYVSMHRLLDCYTSVINLVNSLYTPGIYEGDPDIDSKRRGIYSVAEKVFEAVSEPEEGSSEKAKITWEKLDSLPLNAIVDNAIQCVMLGDLDNAIFGLMYVRYQQIEQTNKGEAIKNDPYSQKE